MAGEALEGLDIGICSFKVVSLKLKGRSKPLGELKRFRGEVRTYESRYAFPDVRLW
jgi:hypothetical protein